MNSVSQPAPTADELKAATPEQFRDMLIARFQREGSVESGFPMPDPATAYYTKEGFAYFTEAGKMLGQAVTSAAEGIDNAYDHAWTLSLVAHMDKTLFDMEARLAALEKFVNERVVKKEDCVTLPVGDGEVLAVKSPMPKAPLVRATKNEPELIDGKLEIPKCDVCLNVPGYCDWCGGTDEEGTN